jgi:hypothetical protein
MMCRSASEFYTGNLTGDISLERMSTHSQPTTQSRYEVSSLINSMPMNHTTKDWILLVDDNSINLKLLEGLLRTNNFNIEKVNI